MINMNIHIDWLFSSIADHLINSCMQGTVFLLVIYEICMLFPKIPSYIQSWLWRIGFLKMLIAFIFLGSMVLPILHAPHQIANNTSLKVIINQLNTQTASDAAHTIPKFLVLTFNPANIIRCLLLLWCAGVVLFSIKLIAAWVRTWRLRIACSSLDDIQLQAELKMLCKQMGIKRQPNLLLGDVNNPLLCGVISPSIILPCNTLEEHSYNDIRLVLAHELAHLKRCDLIWVWLPMIIQCLFFFNPIVWLARKEWLFSQESACDSLAIQINSESKVDYGQMLLKYIHVSNTSKQLATVGVVENYDSLKRRLNAMKNFKTFNAKKQIVFAAIIVVLGLIGILPWALGTAQVVSKQTTRTAISKTPIKLDFYYLKNIYSRKKPSADWKMNISSIEERDYIFTNNANISIDSIKQPQEVLSKVVDIKHNKPILTQKDCLPNASAGKYYTGRVGMTIQLNKRGTKTFKNFTKKHQGEVLAIFINDRLFTAPIINETVTSDSLELSGFKTLKEAQDIADSINTQANL